MNPLLVSDPGKEMTFGGWLMLHGLHVRRIEIDWEGDDCAVLIENGRHFMSANQPREGRVPIPDVVVFPEGAQNKWVIEVVCEACEGEGGKDVVWGLDLNTGGTAHEERVECEACNGVGLRPATDEDIKRLNEMAKECQAEIAS